MVARRSNKVFLEGIMGKKRENVKKKEPGVDRLKKYLNLTFMAQRTGT